MKVSFEYGHGLMTAKLPDSTDIFIPGETVPDPPYIPEDQIEAKTLESIRNPMGMEPLSKLAHKGSKVTIIFPDRVKGGEQPTSHRKVSIRLILQELYAAGVEKKDILLICSNGLHRKNTEQEIRGVLGDGGLTNSGIRIRLLTMTVRITIIWLIWELPIAVTCTDE